MPCPTRWPFVLAFPVGAQLAANLTAREFGGVNVRVAQALEDHFDELVELVDPVQRGRDALPDGADDIRGRELAGNCCRSRRASLRLREFGCRHGRRVAA